eukprot:scaffold108593_cov38-Phaeocystis_antarctica.AAC.1
MASSSRGRAAPEGGGDRARYVRLLAAYSPAGEYAKQRTREARRRRQRALPAPTCRIDADGCCLTSSDNDQRRPL